jgi:hypothetical protein
MTPKEKAIELVEMFMNIKKQKLADYSIIYHPTAKQCALIAVNEILSSFSNIYDDFVVEPSVVGGYKNMKKYWEQVKQEIEQL